MIIFVSMAFPPALSPRAIQVHRLAEAMDTDIILYCCGERKEERREGRIVVRTIPLSAVEKIAIRLCDKFFPILISLPDEYVFWARRVAKAILQDCRPGAQDRLVTFSQPHSDHIAGLLVKKMSGCYWLASFSDPFTDNPFFVYRDLARNITLEKDILQKADKILFTSDETLNLVMAKYPEATRNKAGILEHSFAKDHAGLKERFKDHRNDRFTLRHLGNLYSNRSPAPLIKALVKIQQEAPHILENVTVDFVGHVQMKEEMLRLAGTLPEGVLQFTDTVGYERSLELMHMADVLLLIEAPGEQSVFLPSKLVDYIGAERPIFALTPPGTGARVTREVGGTVCDIGDPQAVYNTLFTVLKDRRAMPIIAASRFSPDKIAGDMKRFLEGGGQ
jgi:hypothetical protein